MFKLFGRDWLIMPKCSLLAHFTFTLIPLEMYLQNRINLDYNTERESVSVSIAY